MSLQAVSLLALALDQITKALVARTCPYNQSLAVIPDYLYLTYIHNPGAAFGFLSDAGAGFRIPFFLAITAGAGIVIHSIQRFIAPERIWVRNALGLIWGGAMGNFVDRLRFGRVVDFIDARYHEHHWYIFNVADSCITVGVVLLILTHGWMDKERTREVP